MDSSLKIKLIALFSFFIIGFIGFKVLFSNSSIDINEETGCPLNADLIENHTMILIDASTPLLPYQQKMLEQYMGSLTKYNMLKSNEMVSIFILNKRPRAIEPIFQKCYPDLNEKAVNIEILKEEYLIPFQDEIANVSKKDYYDRNSQSNSPIMEWIREMLERPDFQNKIQRMIIFSDMIENNPPYFSMYKNRKWFKKSEKYDFWSNDDEVSEYFQSIEYDSNEDFSIAILQLKINESSIVPSSKTIKTFWIDFFKDKSLLVDFSSSCMKNKFINCWEIK